MTRHHGKARDHNEPEIVAALRAEGCSVMRILDSDPAGAPDLCAALDGVEVFMEVKQTGGKLTPHQRKWRRDWKGQPVAIVHTPEEAVDVMAQALRARLQRVRGE